MVDVPWSALRDVVQVLQAIAAPLLAIGVWILRRLSREMAEVSLQLRILNGRMIAIEQWRLDHERHDDSVHTSERERLQRMEGTVDDIQSALRRVGP